MFKIVSAIRFFKYGLPVFFWGISDAVELPVELLRGVGSLQFKEREDANKQLLLWSRTNSRVSLPELLKVSNEHPDPEVSSRCLQVLRELVLESYMKEGEGYLGIQMLDHSVALPGSPELHQVVLVTGLVADGPALRAGVLAGDMLVAVNGARSLTRNSLMTEIRKKSPETLVTLEIFRENKLREIEVKLTRRPAGANSSIPLGLMDGVDAEEESARELYFKNWRSRQSALLK